MWKILPFLLNSKSYTKLHIGDLTTLECESCIWSNNCFQEFIRCLGTNTPNLRELRILISNFECCNFDYSLEERELNSIIQLKNLAILHIHFVSVPLSGIFDISRRCSKLEHILADRVKIDVKPSCAAFGDDFAYIYIQADYLGQMYLEMERTMPTRDPKFKDHTHYVGLKLKPKKHKDLFLVNEFAAKLKQINFHCTDLEGIEEMVDFPHLPHVKYARFDCEGKSAHALRCFLKRNGESLLELDLHHVDSKEKMTFGEIFSFCPNLQSLTLFFCTLFGNDAPVDAMQQLKRFAWHCLYRFASDEVSFSSILSAPLLENLYIGILKIDFSDNATIIARIWRREILRNLKKRTVQFVDFEMDQSDNRLLLTKIRLQHLRLPKSLFSIAIEEFVRIIESSVREKDESKKKTVYIPDHACQMILDKLLSNTSSIRDGEKFEIRLNYFIHLITPLTKEIKLSNFMTFCPNKFKLYQETRVVELLASRASELKSLAFGDSECDKFLRRKTIRQISCLSSLQRLQIFGYKIQFTFLRQLCRSVPSLVNVAVDVVSDVTKRSNQFQCSDSDFERSFSRLKVFLFRTFERENGTFSITDSGVLTQRCIRQLPTLEIVEMKADTKSFGGFELPTEPPLAPSQLRHLCVDLRKIKPEKLAWFPNVTHLRICFKGRRFESISHDKLSALLQFTKIESLVLTDCPNAEILDLLLNKYGQGMHTLCICNGLCTELQYEFRKIFKTCPKLETLALRRLRMVDPAPLDFFAELKNFQWMGRNDSSKYVRIPNILSAPKLENISMSDFIMNQKDTNLVSTLISQKRILRQLKTFKYVPFIGIHSCYFEAMSDLTKNASAFLPNLKCVGHRTSSATTTPNFFQGQSVVTLTIYLPKNSIINELLDVQCKIHVYNLVSFAPFRVAVMPLVKPLCRVCERPTADGAVQAVQLDKENLQTWLLNICGHEFSEEIEDQDLICYFCIWHAEFHAKYVSDLEALVWWPLDLVYLDDVAKELRMKYLEGKAEQCWVQLEKIELPKSKKEENAEHQANANDRNEEKKCFYCGQVVTKIGSHVRKMHENAIRNYHLKKISCRRCKNEFECSVQKSWIQVRAVQMLLQKCGSTENPLESQTQEAEFEALRALSQKLHSF
ncbi:Hypothetical predicted protein [Cloeon dipterum]|uniref:Uncharacterized protein n=1 Tax=Cloeon dipterum TaxID=197152 RepID=A0A8S1EAJ7_9INSE|nr:Hypothetical predicted protein [Cloeon dipterum]